MDGHPIREDLPFYQYAEEWYTLKKEPFISDASRSAYRTMFNKHLLPAFGLRHLRAISADEIQAFINSFADSSKSQIMLAVGTLKALFARAAEGIIERDIDCVGSTAHEGALKTAAANRYIPIPQELRMMLSKVRGFPQQYVFHTEEGQPWLQSSFKRIWLSLMESSYCVEEREVTKATKRKNDISKQLKPTLTAHYFRYNYATLLFEADVEPLIAMQIVGHRDYQTTANIYTHLKEETLKKAAFSTVVSRIFRKMVCRLWCE